MSMQSSHQNAARVAGAALLLFMFMGLASTIYATLFKGLDLLPYGFTAKAFLDGAPMREITDALAKAPQARLAAEAERGTSWMAIGDLGPQVRQGCAGWLFLAEEMAPQPDAAAHLQARAEVVAKLQAALAGKNIRLVVAVVPDKSRIEHTRLCGLPRPPSLEGRMNDWLALLRAARVPAVDLRPPLVALMTKGQDPYFRTDTHWTEEGAAASATLLADAIKGMGVERTPATDWDVVKGAAGFRQGDLVHLSGIDELPRSWQPAPDVAHVSTFKARSAGLPTTDNSGADAELFGDAELPRLVLIGTSFSRNSHFVDFLALALATPVANFGKDGGNFWGAAEAYFASSAFKHTPPRLVIWEMPERVVQRPTLGENWKLP